MSELSGFVLMVDVDGGDGRYLHVVVESSGSSVKAPRGLWKALAFSFFFPTPANQLDKRI